MKAKSKAAALPLGDQRVQRIERGAEAQFDLVFHAGLAPESAAPAR